MAEEIVHPDPRFPNRPNSFEFSQMAEVIRGLDDEIKSEADFDRVLAEEVDEEAASYMCIQRALRLIPKNEIELLALGSGLWLDGMLLGLRYERLRSGNESVTDLRKKMLEANMVEEVAIVAAVQFQRRLKIISALYDIQPEPLGLREQVMFLCETKSIEDWLGVLRARVEVENRTADQQYRLSSLRVMLEVGQKVYDDTRDDPDPVRVETSGA